MKPAIVVDKLSKEYTIGRRQAGYKTVRESLANALTRPWRKLRGALDGNSKSFDAHDDSFWALRDVSFEIQPGEVVGIIGRNGAGKSTLLKILSRITEPTSGCASIHGRIGSLLEVGTGFHPELTGRENIYLNGAILGMERQETRHRFDDIVDFAEIARFLDTPVKRYSSGMYVRLAFAVAAHLQPEVLLVDEVLAVGDLAFQKKCLGKMKDIGRGGRTIFFVSHNMGAIQHLCSRVLFLRNGFLKADGDPNTVIEQFVSETAPLNAHTVQLWTHPNRRKGVKPFFKQLSMYVGNAQGTVIPMGGGIRIKLEYASERDLVDLRVGLAVYDLYGQRLVNFSPTHQCPATLTQASRAGFVECYIPHLNLVSGQYYVTVMSSDTHGEIDRIDGACTFHVVDADVFGTGKVPSRNHGIVYLPSSWSITRL